MTGATFFEIFSEALRVGSFPGLRSLADRNSLCGFRKKPFW
jgi:hypothetical protein